MSSAKAEITALLKKLPDDCTLEDIQYHLYVIEKIKNGLQSLDDKGAISSKVAEERLGRWITS